MDNIPEGQWGALGGKRLQLKLAGRAVAAQKRAVWEETRQYTWWLVVIAVALIFTGTSVGTVLRVRAAVILVGLLVGFVLACIAFRVVRRGCVALNERCRVYDRLVKELELEEPLSAVDDEPNKGVFGLVGGLFGSTQMETWDWFQVTFILAAILQAVGFVAVLVYAVAK
jgi:hypothetical protein